MWWQLVTGRKVERAEHRVHAGGGVADERQIVALGPHEAPERLARFVEELLELTYHERARFALETIAVDPLGSSTALGQAPNDPWFKKSI